MIVYGTIWAATASQALGRSTTLSITFGVFEGFCYSLGMLIGYARVSTGDQSPNAKIDALKDGGAERIFDETVTGKTRGPSDMQHVWVNCRVRA